MVKKHHLNEMTSKEVVSTAAVSTDVCLPAFSPMGDSDDEFDRRRRDKFRRERSDMERSREREDRRRDDWQDRWAHLNTLPCSLWPWVMR